MTASPSSYCTPMPSSVLALLSAAGMPYATPEPSSTAPTFSTTTTSVHAKDTATSSKLNSPPHHDSLDTGVAAGIGVGAGLGIVVLVLSSLALLWWRRRRRRQGMQTGAKAEDVPASASDVEVQEVWFKSATEHVKKSQALNASRSEAPDTSPGGRVVEADDTQRVELVGMCSAAELEAGYQPAELEAWHSRRRGTSPNIPAGSTQ